MESYFFNRYTALDLEVEKVLEMAGGDGCKTIGMYLMSLNYTHKNGEKINFMLCVFYLNF